MRWSIDRRTKQTKGDGAHIIREQIEIWNEIVRMDENARWLNIERKRNRVKMDGWNNSQIISDTHAGEEEDEYKTNTYIFII